MRNFLVTALLPLALALACVSARLTEGSAIDESWVARIQPGVTTRAQVLDWFGAPESFTQPEALARLLQESEILPEAVLDLPFADVLVFETTEARLRGLFLILWNQFRVRIVSDRLVIFFDDSDHVSAFGWKRGTDAVH